MNRTNIKNALNELSNSDARKKTARLNEIFDDVDKAISSGVTHASIVEILKSQGLEFDVKSFSVVLNRIRKKRAENKKQPYSANTRRGEVEESAKTNDVAPDTTTAAPPVETTGKQTENIFAGVAEQMQNIENGKDPRRN